MGAYMKRRELAVQMNYLLKSAGIRWLKKRTHSEMRQIMKANDTVLDRVERQGLRWFGHALRTPEDRWPKKILLVDSSWPQKEGQTKKILEWGHEGNNGSLELTKGRCLG